MNSKKAIIPFVVSIVVFSILLIGAAYSYFSVTSINDFGTQTIDVTAPGLGNVSLIDNNDLKLTLTLEDMKKRNSDIVYYASPSGKTYSDIDHAVGIINTVGDGVFNCDYTIVVDDNSDSLYDIFQYMPEKSLDQIVLTIEGVAYDFNESNLFPLTITGTKNGLNKSSTEYINARLKIINKHNVDQTYLAGTNLTLTFNVTNFECVAIG